MFASRGIVISNPAPRNDVRAKEICAQCPVAAECMATSIVMNEEVGIWGIGGQRRRYLRKQYLTLSASEFAQVVMAEVELLRCGYRRTEVQPQRLCERCARQGRVSWLAEGVFPEDTNGPGARCGKPVTYARGCRCWSCRLAHSMRISGRRPNLTRHGAANTEDQCA